MTNLAPIREFCNNNSTAREWMQSCLTEVINEAVRARDYAAVAAASELMLQVAPDQRLVVQTQEPEQVLTPEVLPPLPAANGDITDWAGEEVRVVVEAKILDFLKDFQRMYGVAFAGSTTIINVIEEPYIKSGKWRDLPTDLKPNDNNYSRAAKPWRMMINSVLYGLTKRGVLDKKNRSYRLALSRKAQ